MEIGYLFLEQELLRKLRLMPTLRFITALFLSSLQSERTGTWCFQSAALCSAWGWSVIRQSLCPCHLLLGSCLWLMGHTPCPVIWPEADPEANPKVQALCVISLPLQERVPSSFYRWENRGSETCCFTRGRWCWEFKPQSFVPADHFSWVSRCRFQTHAPNQSGDDIDASQPDTRWRGRGCSWGGLL